MPAEVFGLLRKNYSANQQQNQKNSLSHTLPPPK